MLGVMQEVCSRISRSRGVNGISGREFRCDDISKLFPPKEERGVVLYVECTCCDIFSLANSIRSWNQEHTWYVFKALSRLIRI